MDSKARNCPSPGLRDADARQFEPHAPGGCHSLADQADHIQAPPRWARAHLCREDRSQREVQRMSRARLRAALDPAPLS